MFGRVPDGQRVRWYIEDRVGILIIQKKFYETKGIRFKIKATIWNNRHVTSFETLSYSSTSKRLCTIVNKIEK